jgi:hypothetical protein
MSTIRQLRLSYGGRYAISIFARYRISTDEEQSWLRDALHPG